MTKRKQSYVLALALLAILLIAVVLSCKPVDRFIPIDFGDRIMGEYSILTANVGNLSLGCRKVLNNLCYKDVEARIAQNIAILKPDIVALQEVLAPWQCDSFEERNPNKVCFDNQDMPQIRRLLGPDYTIACNARNQFECIGVSVGIGMIEGCDLGGLCNTARTGSSLDECDNGFTVSAVTVQLHDGVVFDLVNVHPQSTDASCRIKMIAQIFEGDENNPPLMTADNVLLTGDFNMDPWRDDDESVRAWTNYFNAGWRGKPFQYHMAMTNSNKPEYTSFFIHRRRTFDFIASNFAAGTSIVLGESPETSRLDGNCGTDHRAVFGKLMLSTNS